MSEQQQFVDGHAALCPSYELLFPDPLPTLREAEAALIAEALRRAEGNQGVAARMLGLSRQALSKRLSRSD